MVQETIPRALDWGKSAGYWGASPVPVPAAGAAEESLDTSEEMAGLPDEREAGHGPAPSVGFAPRAGWQAWSPGLVA